MTPTYSATDGSDETMTDTAVMTLRGVEKYFPIKEGVFQRVVGHVRAVDGVSLDIRKGETLGLVGESGCGKTTLGRCISGLTQPTAGGIYFRLPDEELTALDQILATPGTERRDEQRRRLENISDRHRIDKLSGESWRRYRRNCQVVFQDSFSSLNPRQLVKDIVGRPLRAHNEASGSELTEQVVVLLESVGMGRQHLYRYPHQFSGGQRQRISIARALALHPEFIVLDEPTSALDVKSELLVQETLERLKREVILFLVAHRLSTLAVCDRVMVVVDGRLQAIDEPTRLLESNDFYREVLEITRKQTPV